MEFYCTAEEGNWAQICKRLRIPGIDSKELIPPGWESILGLSLKGTQIGAQSSCWCLLKQVCAVLVILPCLQRKAKNFMPLTRAGHQLWKKWVTTDTDDQQPTPDNRKLTTLSTWQPTLDSQLLYNQLPPTDTPNKQNKHLTKTEGLKQKCKMS
jgi:hypothetical protein